MHNWKKGGAQSRGKTVSVRQYAFIASMAGDSETRLDSQVENVTRQPFLIGVAGGTASGKVGIKIVYELEMSCFSSL